MKYKLFIICFVLFICFGVQRIFAQNNNAKPVIKVSSNSTSDKVLVEYSIPRPGFVEIMVFGRNGEVFKAPVYSFLNSGNYTCEILKHDLPVGGYSVELVLDYDRAKSARRGFRNQKAGKEYTNTDAENDLLNKAIMYFGQSPERSVLYYDTLLTKHPDYLNRGSVFSYSIGAYMQKADSLKVCAIIDSVEKYIPHSFSYDNIAANTGYLKKYLSIGIKYAQKAIAHIDDVPLPYRDSYLFNYQRTLGNNYLANGNDKEAVAAFLDALTTFNKLTPNDRYYKYSADNSIYISLASIAERKKSYLEALDFYRKAVIKESDNKEYWGLLQRCYALAYKSDSGYDEYKKQILSLIPGDNKPEAESVKLVGKEIPNLSLLTLEDKKAELKDYRGKVTVLSFWAYWCGHCLDERPFVESLYKEFKGTDLKIIGLHAQIGLFDNHAEELELVKSVLSKNPTSFTNLILANSNYDENGFGIGAWPTTLILDKKGVVRYEEIGFDKNQFSDRMRKNIKLLLEE